MEQVSEPSAWQAVDIHVETGQASFLFRHWTGKTKYGDPKNGGTLVIYSSWGCWGATWHHCAPAFPAFLKGASSSYLIGKLLGDSATVFDAPEALLVLQRAILESRRAREITKEEAYAAFSEVSGMSPDAVVDEDSWYRVIQELGADLSREGMEDVAALMAYPGEYVSRAPSSAAIALRDALLPAFRDSLKAL